MHQVLSQIELAILKEKEEREAELKSRLNRRKLNSASYERRVKDLDKWVNAERKDI